MIGGLTSHLGSVGSLGRRAAMLVAGALVFAFVPANAFANDPATHQYASNLTQICVDGEIVTTTGDGDTVTGGDASHVCDVGGGGGVGDVGDVGGGGAASAPPGAVGDLPFTGFDVAMLAAVATALLAAGLLLRRRRPDSAGA